MNKYGKVAIEAVKLLHNNPTFLNKPKEAWNQALKMVHAAEKQCPYSAFITLCQNGNIRNLPKRHYGSNPRQNKDFTLKAIELLQAGNTYKTKDELWINLIEYFPSKTHQGAIDVIFALLISSDLSY
jgi:hypothetical protein